MAGATRLELATSGLTGRRSNQTELRPRSIRSAEYSNLKFRCQPDTQHFTPYFHACSIEDPG